MGKNFVSNDNATSLMTAIASKVNELNGNTGIVEGESFDLPYTYDGNALATHIYGMSIQDGTPEPSNPVDIVSSKADFRCVGKNLIPYPWYETSSATRNGVSYTIDGQSVKVNRESSSSSNANFWLYRFGTDFMGLKSGRYILSGSGSTDVAVAFTFYQNSTWISQTNATTSDVVIEIDTESTTYNNIGITVFVSKNSNPSNVVVKPMLRLADVTDATYEPYKSTDITTDLTLRAIEVTSSDDYNLEKDGHYYIADTVDWSEDNGYVLTRRIAHREYDGTEEGWAKGGATTTDVYYIPDNEAYSVNNVTDMWARCILSNRFAPDTNGGTLEVGQARNANTRLYFGYATPNTTTLTDWTTFLSNNPVIIDFIKEKYTTTPLTSEQAQSLLSLKTYDVSTSINAQASPEPTVELEYAKTQTTAMALSGHNEALIAQELEGLYGVKNLLSYPYVQTTQTNYGVTFTDNGNGTLTVNGTQDGSANRPYFGCGQWWLTDKTYRNYLLKQGNSIIASISSIDDNIGIRIIVYNSEGTLLFNRSVYGNGELVVGNFSTDTYVATCIETAANGSTINNVTVYPMLRLATNTSNTYQPYAKTNKELTDDTLLLDTNKVDWKSNGVLGAKNLIPYPYHRESGYSSNGLTVTYDEEGVLTVNKVAGSATAYFALFSNTLFPNVEKFLLPNTDYILSIDLENALNTSIYASSSSGVDMVAIRNKTSGYYEAQFTTPSEISSLTVSLYYGKDIVETNCKVKAMIRLASDTDSTYQPYAMSNYELTNHKNGGATYVATCTGQGANQKKVVTVISEQRFTLTVGAVIYVKFDADNTYSATAEAPVQLNVNSTGDITVYGANTAAVTGTNTTYFGRKNYINHYMYDGTYWVWQGSSEDNNSDTKVTQTVTTSNANYEVLFSQTADNTTRTEAARKNSNLKFNPSTGNLQATQLNGVTIGSDPKFTDTTYNNVSTTAAGLAPKVTDTSKYLKGDGTWATPTNTWTAMVGATSSANGSVGYVNAVPPKDGYNTKYLRADGSWQVPPDTDTKKVFFGTCTGQAANQKKAITISSDQNFTLTTGVIIFVKFDAYNTYSATAEAPVQLNVNSTGDITVYGANTAAVTGTNTTFFGRTNYINQYMYDGTYWVWTGSSTDNNNTYTPQGLGIGYGTCTTAASTAAKAATLSGYALVTNGTVAIKFTNAVPANATLNINSKGAKAIYYRGAAITAGVINAGDTATFFYNGSQYHLIAVDNVEKPTFTEASTRENIASGETLTTILGKIKKFFTDIKDLAFIAKDGTSSTKYLRGDGTWQAFPTIPTVNNATLTIQKNGTTVKTFTANASSNVTANITVPTNTSELNNDSGFITDISGKADAKPNVDPGNMNQAASYGNALGMINLSGTNTNINPNGQTGWHHFINMSYLVSNDNMWQTQFAIKAGTTNVWVRSRAGGSIVDGTAWAANWVRLAKTTDIPTSLPANGGTAAKLGRGGNTANPMTFNWSEQSHPTWVWGGEDGTNMYVYRTSNLNVNSATKDSDGNAINTTYLKKSGGNITGNLGIGSNAAGGYLNASATNGGCNSIMLGDDVWLGDVNQGGIMGMKSTGTNCGFRFYKSSGDCIGGLQSSNGTLQWIESGGTARNLIHSGNIGSQSVASATKATQDESGNNIKSSYASSLELTPYGSLSFNYVLKNKNGIALSNGSVTLATSSRRFKENIAPLTDEEAKKILDVEPVTFDYTKDYDNYTSRKGYKNIGCIAEDVNEIIPELVTENQDGEIYGINYLEMVPYLLKVVQMQQTEINNLKDELSSLRKSLLNSEE